jgi:predicted PurR-regulated permease PerM
LCGLVLITACLYWARQVLIPVALAVLLSFILTPCVSALQRRGLGRVTSVLVVVTLTLLLLGGVGYIISHQIDNLVANLPSYRDNIVNKVQALRGAGEGGVLGRISGFFNDISNQLVEDVAKKQVGSSGEEAESSGWGRLLREAVKEPQPGETPTRPMYVQFAASGWTKAGEAIGPAAEGLADAFLVLVLVVFMLIQRENLRNRFVRLLGHGRLIVTTQAFDEGGQRISRYLIMQVIVNTIFGVTLTAGLFVAGLWSGQRVLWQYAILWGFLAGSLRFVPYLGTWLAAALIMGFSVATVPGWGLPLGIFAFFLVLELLTANAVEPLVFGHNTGVSPLALLLAAAFWTWLWGPVGLILSTPLTVILVVLGKYVPELHFFEVLLGDEPALSTHVTFYQRLVARDLDEATDLVEEFLGDHSPEAVYEEVLLPALLLARKDRDRGELDTESYDFVLEGVRDTVEDMASARTAAQPENKTEAPKAIALGCPARDEADELALQMFAEFLRSSGYSMEIISAKKLSAEVMDHIAGNCPAVVCIAALPPGGLSQTRYLCKRIRQQCPNVKIAIGRWGDTENVERMEARLHGVGADHIATTLSGSHEQVVPLLQVAAIAAPAPEAKPDELAVAR